MMKGAIAMTTYKITAAVTAPASQREELKRSAAREIYKQLLKYHAEKRALKTA